MRVPVPPFAANDDGELLRLTWHFVSVGEVSEVLEDVQASALTIRERAIVALVERIRPGTDVYPVAVSCTGSANTLKTNAASLARVTGRSGHYVQLRACRARHSYERRSPIEGNVLTFLGSAVRVARCQGASAASSPPLGQLNRSSTHLRLSRTCIRNIVPSTRMS